MRASEPLDQNGESSMKAEPLFWCVWAENGGSPTVKHVTVGTARKEAQRLARTNPGRRFIVLAAALAYEKTDVTETRFVERDEWRDELDHEIPF